VQVRLALLVHDEGELHLADERLGPADGDLKRRPASVFYLTLSGYGVLRFYVAPS
jgi:hypothetical protein